MPLGPGFRPSDLFPSCVVVKPFKGAALNAVGLSGPGLRYLLDRWNETSFRDGIGSGPWLLSFMSVEPSCDERLSEVSRMCDLLLARGLPGRPGLQVNMSCPNVGFDPSLLVDEASRVLDSVSCLRLPVFLKVNVLFPVRAALQLSDHPACDGFVCSNTVPWGKLPDQIDWRSLFGSETSPLAHLGGGGLSGAPLLPLVARWIRDARAQGISSAIVGGGGVLSPGCADVLVDAGADAIELGSVSMLRPWRVRSIIQRVRVRFSE